MSPVKSVFHKDLRTPEGDKARNALRRASKISIPQCYIFLIPESEWPEPGLSGKDIENHIYYPECGPKYQAGDQVTLASGKIVTILEEVEEDLSETMTIRMYTYRENSHSSSLPTSPSN